MSFRIPEALRNWIVAIAALVVLGAAAAVTASFWMPFAQSGVDAAVSYFRPQRESPVSGVHIPDEAAHTGHAHDHPGHDAGSSLELSTQAMRNIGLSDETIRRVSLETYRKTITVPAVIVERPGRTRVQVATPMTGVITHVHAVQGEAVEPGTLLFQIRLTHEDLVQAQTDFLKTLGELDVEEREIERLQEVTSSGAVAGKLLLDRQYAKDKLTALRSAQEEALRLHGLSPRQVEQIVEERQLLRELQIFAPSPDEHDHEELKLADRAIHEVSYRANADGPANDDAPDTPLILRDLSVHKGQSVNAGETLCVLKDYGELFIEGLAFEQDISALRHTSQQGWTVDAIFQQPGSDSRMVEGLAIAYLANEVDNSSRTLSFYVHLPNTIAKDHRDDGNRYVEWAYLPGQRLQLRVPVETWPNQIVLPVDAVARDGAESFVFLQNGDHFDRIPVHVKYRDQHSVVVAEDGSIFPGDKVAMRGAHQMQMALKNQSGSGTDLHAGHTH